MTGWWCDDVGPRTQPKSQASCHGVHRRDYDPFCADCLPPSRHLAGIANADMVMLDLLFLFSNKGFRWVKSACMSVCVLATLAGQPRAFSKFQACLRANPCRCANACWGGPPPYTCACGIRVGTLMWAMRRPQTSSTGDSTDGLTPPCMWSHMDMDALVPSHDARMAWFVRSVWVMTTDTSTRQTETGGPTSYSTVDRMCTVVHRTCCPTHTTTALARSHPYSTVITPSDSEPRPALTQKAQRTRARGTARGQLGARTAPDMCAPTTPAIRRPYAIARTPPRRPPDRPTVSCPGPGHEIERAPELRRSLARTCGRAPSARESPAGKPPRFAWGLLFASFRHAISR